MPELVLHAQTATELERLVASKPHAVILEAPTGSGKHSVALWLASELTGMAPEKALHQVLIIDKGEDKTVKIEKIRRVEQFLMRKLVGQTSRVVVIEDAHTMTGEAQNALLKTLEEPPEGTIIVLVSNLATALLPTVRSRAVIVSLKRPTPANLQHHFATQGFDDAQVQRALLMSGGLPGLMNAVLTSDTDHPMLAAAATARQLVQTPRFERLTLVDALAKQREQAIAVCQMLQRMAHLKLQGNPLATQWQRILQAAYEAEERLARSGQPKLILTDLMLSF